MPDVKTVPPRETVHSRKSQPELRIGTSGWHYAGWWGPFYPQEIRKKDALVYYATRFNSAELNAPFYRMPTPKAVQNWFETTPDEFRFAWKGSRYITHMKRLLVEKDSIDFLEERLKLLKHKAGPVLFQLPPNMQIDRERLAAFLKLLRKSRQYTFEFRHESWYDKSIFDLLADHDMALCISDHADAPAPCEVTAGWVYIRNHGPSGRYHGSYSARAIADWAREMRKWKRQRRDVWCFFDNDVKSAAPTDAEKLKAKIRKT
ncbi:DUF72 domain-containing protein [Mesorhizobium sp. J18]|uniref:DUF72 domain-containing protein n=1 Tax=Mesorhizobium sp. J18 TaxID=935263 RepID=UPI001FEFB8B3|nr:DUF72 domain-containing protein [Mesorhizobium sp. J18]